MKIIFLERTREVFGHGYIFSVRRRIFGIAARAM